MKDRYILPEAVAAPCFARLRSHLMRHFSGRRRYCRVTPEPCSLALPRVKTVTLPISQPVPEHMARVVSAGFTEICMNAQMESLLIAGTRPMRNKHYAPNLK